MSKIKTKTTAENLEAKFDAGEDVLDYFDVSRMTRPGHTKGGVNVDIPHSMILRIDRIAGRNGLARQAQIKEWLADKLKEEEKAVA
jgi:hypothetical protein